MVPGVLDKEDKNDVESKKWWSRAKEGLPRTECWFSSKISLISENDFVPHHCHPLSPPSLLGLHCYCHRSQGNAVKFQRCRLQGKDMLFPSKWRGKRKKKQSNDLGSFDGKQMHHSGPFKLKAKLLLQQLLSSRLPSGKLAVSNSSPLHAQVHFFISTSPLPCSHSHHLLAYDRKSRISAKSWEQVTLLLQPWTEEQGPQGPPRPSWGVGMCPHRLWL